MAEPARGVQGVRITGPLAPFADDYRVKLRGRGYSARSVIAS